MHNTTYEYSDQAALSQNELCLFPRNTFTQTCESKNLKIIPKPSTLELRMDYFGNHIHTFMVQQPHHKLEIITESVLNKTPPINIVPESTMPWENVSGILHEHKTIEDLDALQYIFPSSFIKLSSEFRAYALLSFAQGCPILVGALNLTDRIYKEFTYDKEATHIGISLNEVLKIKRGVCQDFAHFQIACLRSIGLAARYVSGYLETLPPPGKPKMVGVDASHAWLSIYVPTLGWVDIDPTNNMIPGERHVVVAWGRDYGDVTPVKGVIWGGGTHKLSVAVDVMAFHS